MLHAPEQKFKYFLLPFVPKWLETYHLTMMTVPWCGGILLFAYFARFDINWLWGVSVMIFAQYVTDLLDGAIGRQRDTGLVKWGFYMDHFLDFLFLCAILIGYAIILPPTHRMAVFFVMELFAGFMVNSFLSFAATDKFQIAYMGIGPTEIRVFFILTNTFLVFFGTGPMIAALPYTLAAATFGLFFTVYRTQRDLWRVDMSDKYAGAKRGGGTVPTPPPRPRHRRSFAAALATAVAGIWLATVPTREIAVPIASLALLAVAAGLFVISLLDFRRLRVRRRFFLVAILHYLPYLLAGALILLGLRAWFILEPHDTCFPPAEPLKIIRLLFSK